MSIMQGIQYAVAFTHIVLNSVHVPHQGLWYISVAKGLAAAGSQCRGHTLLGLSVQMPHLNLYLGFIGRQAM